MNVMVTGGAGYIGSHVVSRLLDRAYIVTVVDDLSTGFTENIGAGADFVEASCGDGQAIHQLLVDRNIQAIFHFAARLDAAESVHAPLLYYKNNTCNLVNLLEACRNTNVTKFVFSSSAAVYGEPKEQRVTELSPCRPINPYGHSKAMSEQILMDFAKEASPLKWASLRYFNVAGAAIDKGLGQRARNATNLIKVASEVAAGKRPSITMFGDDYDTPDGTCIRDYVHVVDLAEAHLRVLDFLIDGGDSQVFNCGYGRGHSVKEVLDVFQNLTGNSLRVVTGSRREGDPAKVIACSDKLKKLTGWKPKLDNIETICHSSLTWEQALCKGLK